MYQAGKIDNVKKEMKRIGINILGISEVRWTGVGQVAPDKISFIYSGGDKHDRGVGIMLEERIMKRLIYRTE